LVQVTELVMTSGSPGIADDGWVVGIYSEQTSPPALLLGVSHGDGPTHQMWVGLGGTFRLGEQIWRFEDIRFLGAPDRYRATLRYVPPGAPPFTPPPLTGDRVWNEVELRHHGPVSEAEIARLEAEFGQQLPSLYRRWLAAFNGATPTQLVATQDSVVLLDQHQGLLGIHPDAPHTDLRVGRQHGAGLFTEDYMVIAVAVNGLLAVRVGRLDGDVIVALDHQARGLRTGYAARGYATQADYVCAELLTPVAPDIYSFEAALQPLPAMPPATFG
jgi:hypothetical protein